MNLNKRVWTQAEIATRALEMLAIGNQAVHRAQARKEARKKEACEIGVLVAHWLEINSVGCTHYRGGVRTFV